MSGADGADSYPVLLAAREAGDFKFAARHRRAADHHGERRVAEPLHFVGGLIGGVEIDEQRRGVRAVVDRLDDELIGRDARRLGRFLGVEAEVRFRRAVRAIASTLLTVWLITGIGCRNGKCFSSEIKGILHKEEWGR